MEIPLILETRGGFLMQLVLINGRTTD